ncbi:uncharacterized protein LOC118484014 [Helianthus annuus]|uniref:uncharacterized protein LOC118484014 n=1 Tax=Helianthus annuus TaxID=4232 RepID=UPI001652DCFA|nr:uncharacterized protein LOC118484014 [Helianthus annuus]
MKIGFDKNKVTCFKCKQKGHFKRECTNNKADDSVNPFYKDYCKKAIYHQNNEQPTRKQIEEGPSKEKRQAAMTLRDRSESSIQNEKYVWDNFDWDKYFDETEGVRIVIHDDEGYDWSQHDKEDGKAKAMVAEIKQSREERHARIRLDEVYDAYKEATQAGRWSKEKECFVDPQGNPTVDPETVDFEALVATIPTVSVWCKGLEEIPRNKEKVQEGIRKVIYASLEKKKTVEEIVDESEKLVKEVKKADEKVEEAIAEKQQEIEEDQNQQAKEATVPNTGVTTQTDSSNQSVDNKAEQQCKKCMETCSKTTKCLEARYEGKQMVLNQYIDDVAKLKQELADKEKLVNKLQSYHASSYILEHIFNITPDGKESEKNKKGIGSE